MNCFDFFPRHDWSKWVQVDIVDGEFIETSDYAVKIYNQKVLVQLRQCFDCGLRETRKDPI